MSRLWPHTPYAEDQPDSQAILWTHVLTRGIQTGALIGAGVGSSLYLLRKSKTPPTTFANAVIRSSGVGAVVGLGIFAIGLPLRMRGREEIEWQDRSWRLLENKGQVECDDWTYPGMAAGLIAVVGSASGRSAGWRGVAAGAGLGSVLGMVGYMGWRYGVKGGKFEEEL